MELHRFQGKLLYDSQTPANSKVDLKIAAASITVNDTWLKPSDQKKVLDYAVNDMLAVKQYPDIRFVSTKVTPKGGNQFMIEGTLTIRGNGKTSSPAPSRSPASTRHFARSINAMTGMGRWPTSGGRLIEHPRAGTPAPARQRQCRTLTPCCRFFDTGSIAGPPRQCCWPPWSARHSPRL